MLKPEDETFGVPRFLSFIDLAYLVETAKAADNYFAARVSSAHTAGDRNAVGNLNATRQSLLRAIFISSYAILEQNLDELVEMERKRNGISLSPSDLKDRGIARSLTYATKVLGKTIDVNQSNWKDVLLLQGVRNHLAHYGPEFADSKSHDARFEKFASSEYVTLRPAVCFTIEQIEGIAKLYVTCVTEAFGNEESPA